MTCPAVAIDYLHTLLAVCLLPNKEAIWRSRCSKKSAGIGFKMFTAVRHASKQDDDGVTVTLMAGFKFAAGLLVYVLFPAHMHT